MKRWRHLLAATGRITHFPECDIDIDFSTGIVSTSPVPKLPRNHTMLRQFINTLLDDDAGITHDAYVALLRLIEDDTEVSQAVCKHVECTDGRYYFGHGFRLTVE